MENFVGSMVSVHCGDVLGTYQGIVLQVDSDSQTLMLKEPFCNGLQAKVPTVTIKWVYLWIFVSFDAQKFYFTVLSNLESDPCVNYSWFALGWSFQCNPWFNVPIFSLWNFEIHHIVNKILIFRQHVANEMIICQAGPGVAMTRLVAMHLRWNTWQIGPLNPIQGFCAFIVWWVILYQLRHRLAWFTNQCCGNFSIPIYIVNFQIWLRAVTWVS